MVPSKVAYNVTSYQHHLQAKLSQPMDFVEAHNTQAAVSRNSTLAICPYGGQVGS